MAEKTFRTGIDVQIAEFFQLMAEKASGTCADVQIVDFFQPMIETGTIRTFSPYTLREALLMYIELNKKHSDSLGVKENKAIDFLDQIMGIHYTHKRDYKHNGVKIACIALFNQTIPFCSKFMGPENSLKGSLNMHASHVSHFPKCIERSNDYITKETNGYIKNFVTPDMFNINSTYFLAAIMFLSGKFNQPFKGSLSCDAWLEKGAPDELYFMENSEGRGCRVYKDGGTFVEIPCYNNLSMMLYMNESEKNKFVSPATLFELSKQAINSNVNVKIPSGILIKSEYIINENNYEGTGLDVLFEEIITPDLVPISMIKQVTVLNIGPDGFAVTSVASAGFISRGICFNTVDTIIFNSPFTIAIVDKFTKNIYLYGSIERKDIKQ